MATTSQTYRYLVLKSAWGIVADITARIEDLTETPGIGEMIRPGVWLVVEEEHVSVGERHWFRRAMEHAAMRWETQVDTPCAGVVERFTPLMETDYQEEGAALALLGWLRTHAGVDVPEIDVHYNAQAKRYKFVWPVPD